MKKKEHITYEGILRLFELEGLELDIMKSTTSFAKVRVGEVIESLDFGSFSDIHKLASKSLNYEKQFILRKCIGLLYYNYYTYLLDKYRDELNDNYFFTINYDENEKESTN